MLQIVSAKLDIVLCALGFHYLKNVHTKQTGDIITNSTLLFGLSYGLIKVTRLFHPPRYLNPHVEAEWRSRVIGTVHATIITVGSILCFLEWSQYEKNEGWAYTNTDIYYYPELFASIFGGYLQYDLIWLLWNKKDNFDLASIVHHVLYLAITHYVLWGRFFGRPFAWLSFGELSTPFLHLRWFCAVLDRKDSSWYSLLSILFAVTFLFTRVLCYGLGLVDIWISRDVWLQLPYGLHAVVLGVHLGYGLNLFWAQKVGSALLKRYKK